jgi:hypothetical protein
MYQQHGWLGWTCGSSNSSSNGKGSKSMVMLDDDTAPLCSY